MKVEELLITEAPQNVNLLNGKLGGENVRESIKKLRDLRGIFEDENTRDLMDEDTVVYKVQVHASVESGVEGGLLFGTTYLMPGKVGNEYFLTQGHFHKIGNRAEYYWGIEGDGVLVLMNRNRVCKTEKVQKGSLHYIPANTAHRVVNTGNTILSFGACWPSDAGYDYEEIKQNGFSVRVVEIDGAPAVVSML